ncbi:SRPBCC family protein [Paraburkholderia sp. RL17-373-BIF-A]|uniref:SRPBCC family protein n=1 Tax=Paraburkholderia sp. RL17-373-BIF-A TaxID=3031629 RepID=UPI0038BB043D
MSQSTESYGTLLAALERGDTLPSQWYTDPAIADRELHQIFRKTWSYIGPLNELETVGDYITGYVGDVPVVVVRNEIGLTALVNVCRHRRHEVMKGRGNAKMMQCGYHAWAYDLSGCLKGAPRTATESGFCLDEYPLLPLKVDALGPWVFVNLDCEAIPLAQQYSALLDLIAESGIDLRSLELHSRVDWESHSNWKTMLENYLECYHCAVAHPSFSAAIDVRPENYNLGIHGMLLSQIGHARKPAVEDDRRVKTMNLCDEVSQAQYHLLFPNMTINVNPGFPNLSIDVWRPNGPGGCNGFSEQYFGPGVTKEFAEGLIEFNRQVGAEDDALTDSVQRGLRAGIPARGRFLTDAEHLVGHFQKLTAAAVVGMPGDLNAAVRAPDSRKREISSTLSESVALESERNKYVELEVVKVEQESEVITSFYLRRVDGKPLYSWRPGQFLPIRVEIPGQAPATRTYTLSTASNVDHYRLSVRLHEGDALVSRFLHANAKPGLRIEAMAPRGKYVLTQSGDRPVVLISGGVGITPMIAMVEHIVSEGERTGAFRPVYFIHGAHSGKALAFGKQIAALAKIHPCFKVHFCFSRPADSDVVGTSYHTHGQVSIDTIEKLLPFGDYEFYLCGPSGFMKSLYDGLTTIGVSSDRIFYESFGPSTILGPKSQSKVYARRTEETGDAVTICFQKADTCAEWSSECGTLLEFAESLGFAPKFGCRSGICGSCATPILEGSVDYLEDTVAPRKESEILLCCSVPRAGVNVVLDL